MHFQHLVCLSHAFKLLFAFPVREKDGDLIYNYNTVLDLQLLAAYDALKTSVNEEHIINFS